jgi:hypothetical protein
LNLARPTEIIQNSVGVLFDSHRPLYTSRCFHCPYTANLPESSLKMGPFWTPNGLHSVGVVTELSISGKLFDETRVDAIGSHK